MKEIGGYFGLELPFGFEFHQDLLRLNSARNALFLILSLDNVDTIYIPSYCCDSVLEPIKKLGISYRFLSINQDFELIDLDINLGANDRLLYINYFGMKDHYINYLIKIFNSKLIVDNTQAFFSVFSGIKLFYSPRKFFGVPDGAYVQGCFVDEFKYEKDVSFWRMGHLLGRLDESAEKHYSHYIQHEKSFSDQPIRRMSKLTQRILSSIDYMKVGQIRKSNFSYLHKYLADINRLSFATNSVNFTPFMYPFLPEGDVKKIKSKLLDGRVYTPVFWKEVLDRPRLNDYERDFVMNMIPIPIDQRYDTDDMQRILEVILND